MKTFTFLFIAFVWSWVWWFIGLHYIAGGLNDHNAKPFINCLLAGIYGPTLSAVVTSLSFGGPAGLNALLKRILLWRAPWYVYLIIVFLPLVFAGSAIGLYALFKGSPGKFDAAGFAMIPVVLVAAIKAGPLGEELGWRGFLLPEMQKRFPAIVSALIVGVIWFAWHIPLFFAPIGTAVSGSPVTVESVTIFLVFVLCLSCIYTWMFNRAGGSALITLLIHFSINAGLLMLFFPQLAGAHSREITMFSLPVYVITALILIFGTKLR
jgi:hypothetical protein